MATKSKAALTAALVVGIVLLLASVLALELRSGHAREIKNAQTITASMARVLERELLASIGKIDLIVQEAQYQYQAHLDGNGLPADQLSPTLKRLLERVPGVLSLRLVDENGNYVFDARGTPSNANIADRKYFRVHEDGRFNGLFAEGPLFSRVANMWTFTFSRGVRDREGRFRGIVQSSIPSKSLAAAFESIALNESDSVTLLNADRVLIARAPDAPAEIGKAVTSSALAQAIDQNLAEGHYLATSAIDGISRIYSYRRVAGMPLYIVTGISEQRILAEWRRTAQIYALVAVLLLAGGIALVVRTYRKVEASQAKEELRYKELLRTSTDGVHILDSDGNLLEASDSFYHMLGLSPEETRRLNVRDWDAQFDDERLLEMIRQNLGDETTFETRHRRRDGRIIDVEVRTRGINLAGERFLYCSARDVTEHNRAAEQLKASEEFYHAIADNGQALIWMAGRNKHCDYFNQPWLNFTGCSLEQELGSGWRAGVHPDDLDRCIAVYQAAYDLREKFSMVYRLRRYDDQYRWIIDEGLPRYNQTGHFIGYVGHCLDITDIKTAQNQLENYRQHLEILVRERTEALQHANQQLFDTQFAMDSVGIGIHWIDFATGRFLYANRSAADLLGYTVDEMLRLGVSDIDPNYPPDAYHALCEQVRQHSHVHLETTQRSRDGRIIPVDLIVYYQPAQGGSPARLISFESDITQRKEAEKALLHAKEAAENANVTKSAFLANMSHEIRTPLNAITGMAHLIRRSGVAPEQADRLDKIDAAGQHLLEIINAVLDLSKIEAGKFALEQTEVQVEAVTANVLSMIFERAQAKNLTLVDDTHLPPYTLLGDPTRLQQALLNYAANAVKFTDCGSITFRASVQEDAPDSLLIRFEVSDTGIGIASEKLETLFTAFEQADNSISRKYGGTGLGLAITKKFAEMMGGQVGASSTLGGGSTFWFTARLQKRAGVSAPAPSRSEDPPETILRRDFSGCHLLLAEDDPVNREVALAMLQIAGMTADVAEDGQQAVELAKSRPYDLILMDMQMPGMDGLEATRLIRQLPGGKTLPILAMTANAFVEDKSRCIEVGMDDFIAKPVRPSALYSSVLHWLSGHN